MDCLFNNYYLIVSLIVENLVKDTRYYENEKVIARWSSTNVWYNCVIKEVLPGNKFRVLYTDYGNEDVVPLEQVVSEPSEIPVDGLVDDHILPNEFF